MDRLKGYCAGLSLVIGLVHGVALFVFHASRILQVSFAFTATYPIAAVLAAKGGFYLLSLSWIVIQQCVPLTLVVGMGFNLLIRQFVLKRLNHQTKFAEAWKLLPQEDLLATKNIKVIFEKLDRHLTIAMMGRMNLVQFCEASKYVNPYIIDKALEKQDERFRTIMRFSKLNAGELEVSFKPPSDQTRILCMDVYRMVQGKEDCQSVMLAKMFPFDRSNPSAELTKVTIGDVTKEYPTSILMQNSPHFDSVLNPNRAVNEITIDRADPSLFLFFDIVNGSVGNHDPQDIIKNLKKILTYFPSATRYVDNLITDGFFELDTERLAELAIDHPQLERLNQRIRSILQDTFMSETNWPTIWRCSQILSIPALAKKTQKYALEKFMETLSDSWMERLVKCSSPDLDGKSLSDIKVTNFKTYYKLSIKLKLLGNTTLYDRIITFCKSEKNRQQLRRNMPWEVLSIPSEILKILYSKPAPLGQIFL